VKSEGRADAGGYKMREEDVSWYLVDRKRDLTEAPHGGYFNRFGVFAAVRFIIVMSQVIHRNGFQ
jgi:hypothetical protein